MPNKWTEKQWRDLHNRSLGPSKIQSETNTLLKNSQHKNIATSKASVNRLSLTTTPAQDSTFTYMQTHPYEATYFITKNSDTGDFMYNLKENGQMREKIGVQEKDLPAQAKNVINTIRNRFGKKEKGGQLERYYTEPKLIPKTQAFRKFKNSGKIEIPVPEEYIETGPMNHYISTATTEDDRMRTKNNKNLHQNATQSYVLNERGDGTSVFEGTKSFDNYGRPAEHNITYITNLDGTIDYEYYQNNKLINHGYNVHPDQMDNTARYQYENMLKSLKKRDMSYGKQK